MTTDHLDSIARDNEGYLLDPAVWNEDIAAQIASQENIELSPDHWLIVTYVRDYFEEKQVVPEARSVLRHLKETMSPEKATRRYLYDLFPYGYGQQACKIAGMRKPLKIMLDV